MATTCLPGRRRALALMGGSLVLMAGMSAMPWATSLAYAADAAKGRAVPMLAALEWNVIADKARGQRIDFHAWGGSEATNAYLRAQAEIAAREHGIEVRHVKIADTAESVSTLLAEKAAGRSDGSIDVIWINGENFRALKQAELVWGPFVERLPNSEYLLEEIGARDFGLATEGMEAPWGRAQLIFMYDSALLESPPRSMQALLDVAKANPGRVTYPQPPSFHGTTFLKQALLELMPGEQRELLAAPVASDALFAEVTAPLWDYLDALHPLMWAQGERQPAGAEEQMKLLAQRSVWIALSFVPQEVANARQEGRLPPTIEPYIHDGGTLGNVHYLAIPASAPHKAAALVWVNQLMSAEAQAAKADPSRWGDETVLDVTRLPAAQRAAFDALPELAGGMSPEALGTPLSEPHPSWTDALEAEWARRYRN
ncbi:ABC transporter substrate-binding protein [Cobetia sp. 14N.309.X.WAT.E.A4]|uniref:ABC transporter substrate-binding protein n=1 Tax=Cobetia sp. 14N.309.X.WAT.E.A4 TaxID=2998323 RepID=UPI0025AEFF7B|nr:ABC transporter substrate-binding protein [Cobetia sp. 14N.309.X.WAT.E.A4]MDN2656886.1 ABC transporter substrate-binding protein [Cobetia sp. 14N.309.X.WAT.E.A4]